MTEISPSGHFGRKSRSSVEESITKQFDFLNEEDSNKTTDEIDSCFKSKTDSPSEAEDEDEAADKYFEELEHLQEVQVKEEEDEAANRKSIPVFGSCRRRPSRRTMPSAQKIAKTITTETEAESLKPEVLEEYDDEMYSLLNCAYIEKCDEVDARFHSDIGRSFITKMVCLSESQIVTLDPVKKKLKMFAEDLQPRAELVLPDVPSDMAYIGNNDVAISFVDSLMVVSTINGTFRTKSYNPIVCKSYKIAWLRKDTIILSGSVPEEFMGGLELYDVKLGVRLKSGGAKTTADFVSPYLTQIIALSDRILALDANNIKLKLFNDDLDLMSEFQLCSLPIDMTPAGDKEFALLWPRQKRVDIGSIEGSRVKILKKLDVECRGQCLTCQDGEIVICVDEFFNDRCMIQRYELYFNET